MKTKYTYANVYATQGGGEAVREGNRFIFIVVPDWSTDIQVGDLVPEEWGVQFAFRSYSMTPKQKQEIKSRNRREGTYEKRRHPYTRKHKIRRIHKKKAKLAFKGTMRSVSSARINAVMHWVGVLQAKETRRYAYRNRIPLKFNTGDQVRAIKTDSMEDLYMEVGDICTVTDGAFKDSPRFVVKNHRTSSIKVLPKSLFILHKRFIENE